MPRMKRVKVNNNPGGVKIKIKKPKIKVKKYK